MPPMAAANGMGVDEVPLQLQELNWVETMLIQLAKPFQVCVTFQKVLFKIKPHLVYV